MIYFFGFLGALLLVHLTIEAWPRTKEQEFRRHYRRWLHDARARGLSSGEQLQEFRFRSAWAKLRQRASESVMGTPDDITGTISKIAIDEAKALAVVDKAVAKRFLLVVKDAPVSDILYPDVMKELNRRARRTAVMEIGDHHVAAVRTATHR